MAADKMKYIAAVFRVHALDDALFA
ncbi:uncharacterized protein G2W53_014579 [Senna tora]|uniref:Uncharacterized protein n=1 Tax=Senna tora TaxID=362788 RepID=A0A835C6M8_9FABA|nr:uncharacterized protein G2W53_014579 [Senna tora]